MTTESAPTSAPAATAHTIAHVELPATDAPKLRAFYSALFGWTFAGMPAMPEYLAATLGSGSDTIGFAIFPRQEGAGLTNYVGVASVDEHAAKLEQLGGKVLNRFVVANMGRGAIATDPEGNLLGLWQNDPTARE